MKLLIVLVIVAMCSAASTLTQVEIDQQWGDFKVKHNRNYSEQDESFRKDLFTKTLQQVTEHNKKYEQGLVTYQQGINMFADMTEEEKRPYSHGVLPPKSGTK